MTAPRASGQVPQDPRRRAVTVVLRDYEFLGPLAAGDVASPDLELTLIRDANALDRTLTDPAVDAGESSLSRHITRVANGDTGFVGIPFFTTGGFRQRGFFVRRDSHLRSFADLAGTRIGTNEWPATGSIWARAALRDAGVDLDGIRWWLGSVDGAPGKATQQHDAVPANVHRAPAGRTLSGMLRDGELEALMCPRPPKDFHGPDATILRLLPDYKASEAEYFRRTGIRPVAHIIGVRRRIYDECPWILRSLYATLEDSKLRWQARLGSLADELPWLLPALLIEETVAVFGPDWLPNGIEPNSRALEALVAEQEAQGLLAARVAVEDLFREFLGEMQRVG